MPLLYDLSGPPIEIAPGRGDLRYSSYPVGGAFDSFGVNLIGKNRTISYGRLFATQPWIAAAVIRLLSWSIRVPLKTYRRTGEDSRVRLMPGDHPLATALASPWERGSQADLIQSVLGPYLVHGNGTTQVEEGAANAIQFKPWAWQQATPIWNSDNEIIGWTVNTGSENIPVGVDVMLHLSTWSPFGPVGISPLYQLGVTLRIEDAAQRFQEAMMRNSARPPSAITASEQFLGLEKDEREALLKQLRADVDTLYAGPENSGRPALLPPGLTWDKIGHTAVEAELIDQRKVAREEVAAVFQIPPPLMGILDKATYSNISVQREMGYTDSLGPPLIVIEQSINAQIVSGLLRETDIFVEFDFAGVLRGDRLKEIQALREAISTGLLMPNEGRSILNYPQVDDELASTLWMPRNNLRPINEPPYLPRGGTVEPDDDKPAPAPTPDEPAGDIGEND